MSRMIDPYAGLPKYYQLAAILREKIDNGEWEPRSAIPSERQLETLYDISRTTIREAIDMLVRQGYLYREQGRGTYVSPQKLQKAMLDLTSFSEDLVRRGIQPGQIIRSLEWVVPHPKILQKLELPPASRGIAHRAYPPWQWHPDRFADFLPRAQRWAGDQPRRA